MNKVSAGTWVEIERVLLKPEQRAANIPEDTLKTPYIMRVSGFLTEDALPGEMVTIRTVIGRHLDGTLNTILPHYEHSFGETVPELLEIGLGGKA